MNILVVVESLRINETSSGIVSSTFLTALSKDDELNITCLYDKAFDYELTWLENIELIQLHKRPYKQNSLINKIPKFRAISTYLTGIHPKDRHKILDWESGIKELLSQNQYDLIITLGSGSEFLPHHAMLGVKTATLWLANFHDPFPMSVYPEPYRKKRDIIQKKQELNTKRIIKRANFVSFPSILLKDLMQKHYGFPDTKSIILPHVGIHIENLPDSRNDTKVSLEEGKFNLLHAGTLLGPRKVDNLLQAFSRFIQSDKNKQEKSVLTILGKVAKENFSSLETKLPNDNLRIITDRVSYKRSIELNKQADVSVIVEANTEFSPFMPGKLADLLFLEKPILLLSPKKSEVLRILGNQYEYYSESANEDRILKTLDKLWDSWIKNDLVLSNKKELKEYISGENLVRKIKKVVNA